MEQGAWEAQLGVLWGCYLQVRLVPICVSSFLVALYKGHRAALWSLQLTTGSAGWGTFCVTFVSVLSQVCVSVESPV
jgi:hypothetical protein